MLMEWLNGLSRLFIKVEWRFLQNPLFFTAAYRAVDSTLFQNLLYCGIWFAKTVLSDF